MTHALAQHALIWSNAVSIGCSREAYFGSRTAGEQIIMVRRTTIAGERKFEILWNDGSSREVANAAHEDLYVAIEAAEAEVARVYGAY